MKLNFLMLLFFAPAFLQAQTYSNNTPVSIPDGGSGCWGTPGAATSSTINVPISGTIATPSDVTIAVNLSHTWMGDLRVELVTPDNSSCNLISRSGSSGSATSCGSSNNFNGVNTLSFNSANVTPVPVVNNVPAGNYAPTVGASGGTACNLSAFLNGKSINGNWQLRATDGSGGDLGQIVSWSITFAVSVLPVKITSFTAYKRTNNNVELAWTVDEQIQIRHYVVERSSNGIDFSPIAVVVANSLPGSAYSYVDLSPLNGVNYYRIRVVEMYGPETYSSVRSIRITYTDGVTVLNNPFETDISLVIYRKQQSTSSVSVYDLYGRKLFSKNLLLAAGATALLIPAAAWSGGVYTIMISDNTGADKEIIKVIKQ